MTTPQLMIIRDYLSRKRWAFLTLFVVHLLATSSGFSGGPPVLFAVMLGPLILAAELKKGGTRTMLALLPVSVGQLARCWRFNAFTFPAIWFLAALLLAAAFGMTRDGSHVTAEFVIILAISQTLLLGTTYCYLTGSPGKPRQGDTFVRRTMDICSACLWGLLMPATVYLPQAIPIRFTDFGYGHIAGGCLLAVASVVGWQRADGLVRQEAARPGPEVKPMRILGAPIRITDKWKGFGALTYLYMRFGSTAALFLLGGLLVSILLNVISGDFSVTTIGIPAGFIVAASGFGAAAQLLGQLRLLRTLPLRASTLTHCLVFWPIAVYTVLGLSALAMESMLGGKPINWTIFRYLLITASGMQSMLPLVLRFGVRLLIILPLPMLTIILLALSFEPFAVVPLISWPWALSGIGLLLAVIWGETYRLLGTPCPWRGGVIKFHNTRPM